jgi:hypothetical protein
VENLERPALSDVAPLMQELESIIKNFDHVGEEARQSLDKDNYVSRFSEIKEILESVTRRLANLKPRVDKTRATVRAFSFAKKLYLL